MVLPSRQLVLSEFFFFSFCLKKHKEYGDAIVRRGWPARCGDAGRALSLALPEPCLNRGGGVANKHITLTFVPHTLTSGNIPELWFVSLW